MNLDRFNWILSYGSVLFENLFSFVMLIGHVFWRSCRVPERMLYSMYVIRGTESTKKMAPTELIGARGVHFLPMK